MTDQPEVGVNALPTAEKTKVPTAEMIAQKNVDALDAASVLARTRLYNDSNPVNPFANSVDTGLAYIANSKLELGAGNLEKANILTTKAFDNLTLAAKRLTGDRG